MYKVKEIITTTKTKKDCEELQVFLINIIDYF